jgi:DNA-binding transcriptional ArsR family regulator
MITHATLDVMSHGAPRRSTHSAGPLDREMAGVVAATMHALATASRVLILDRLRLGECSVGELVEALGMEQSAVSHQLRVLRELGLVVGERHGRRVLYALYDPHVGELVAEAIGHVEHLQRDQAISFPYEAVVS